MLVQEDWNQGWLLVERRNSLDKLALIDWSRDCSAFAAIETRQNVAGADA
jgi:hypothetical protein